MTTQEAINYFGGIKELAAVLNVWPQTIMAWKEHPPLGRQYELHVKTNGELKVDDHGKH